MHHQKPEQPRIYLAGPDLFFADADERYARLKAACQFAGLVGVAPNDGLDLPGAGLLSDEDMARAIYDHDMRALVSCDAVLANLSAFRGTEPDSGTVFEAAYAFALGIPVVGWTGDGWTTKDRATFRRKVWRDVDGTLRDKLDGGEVEDFGLPLNLMLACSFPVVQTPQQATQQLARILVQRTDATAFDLETGIPRWCQRIADHASGGTT
ncbi:MAG: nucleoside 2-deoxyribosyltransferase [Thiomonas arsenitoxydans]|jgi:nucleoside 2-deoxyribosyltransferase|nr:nucleoside 2-deoxyribosyltransferase [Thiomonas arsenitoxydans]